MSVPATEHPPLLGPEFQDRLAALEITLRRALPSDLRGDRRSPTRKGISLEFADFRPYVPGDDVRHLDWAAYARLDQLIVKLYHDEEDVHVHLLVDDSRSMSLGEPSKARFVREVAAALAWIGLAGQNRVSVVLLREEPEVVAPARGPGEIVRILQCLDAPSAESRAPLHACLREYMNRVRPRGVLILLSDLLDPEGPRRVLGELLRPATEIDVLHVLAPDELDPGYEGDLRLVDAESGARIEVSLTAGVLDAYRARARAFVAECAEVCRARNAAYARTTSDTGLEDFVRHVLLAEGILR